MFLAFAKALIRETLFTELNRRIFDALNRKIINHSLVISVATSRFDNSRNGCHNFGRNYREVRK